MLRDRLVTVKDIPAFHHSVDLILFSSPLGSLIPLWKKFWLNPTYHLGADVAWRFSKWPPWRPAWILEWNGISNSESSCYPQVSHQVSPGFELSFWISERNDFSNSVSSCLLNASHQVSAQNYFRFGRFCLKNFKMAAILDIGKKIC